MTQNPTTNTEAGAVAEVAAIARFWTNVNVLAADECWPWLGRLTPKGYGQFSARIGDKVKSFRAHRLAFELSGNTHNGLPLDHICRNRACCNPHHLEAVTSKVNTLRGEGLAAVNAKKTVCPAGHPLDGDNLVIMRSKGRTDRRGCRICRTAARQKYRPAKTASEQDHG